MPVVENAIYVEGVRASVPENLAATLAEREKHDGLAWVGLTRPTEEELGQVAEQFGLHELAVEDALKGHQRSKLEHFGDAMSLVVRSARYNDASETVSFGDVHIFVGQNYVVTVGQDRNPNLGLVRKRLEADPELLALGPLAVLYGILDLVVDGYNPVVTGLENDIDEIEDQIFGGGPDGISQRIYELQREVITFQRAVQPLSGMLKDVRGEASDEQADVELRRLLRDVHDHALRVNERVDAFRTLLDNALTAHGTIVAQQHTAAAYAQNEQIKRLSAWAAILFAPSLIGTTYGMNFDHMPELRWEYGYLFALGLMAALGLGLYFAFRKMKWL